ncbi:thioredoxin fold domain-containing protein [Marinitoga arctica]
MKKLFSLFIILISIISFSSKLEDFIVNDYDNAIKIGKLTQKNIIIMFSSKTCYYCNKFKSEVLVDDEIQKWLKTEFIFAEIYADKDKYATIQNKKYNYMELFGAFGVRGTPTFFFFNTDGEPLTQLPGYVNKDMFLSILKFIKYIRKEKIGFEEFLNKGIKVSIDKKVLRLKKDEIEFLLKNDPNTKEYNKRLNEYTNIVIKDENKELEKKYFVIIYEE